MPPLLHQQDRPAPLDFAGDFPVHMSRHTGNATRKNLAALGDEFLQKIRIFVIDRFGSNIDPAPRHGAVGAAKSRSAFGGFGLHQQLFGFPVKSSPPQKRVVFLLFKTVRRPRAFFVPGSHVTRNRFAQRLRLGAFKDNDLLGHKPIPWFRLEPVLPLPSPSLRLRSSRRARSPIAGHVRPGFVFPAGIGIPP